MTTHDVHKKILAYVDLIQRKPKKDIKFFYFDDGKKFIVDGNRLKLLPFEFHQFYTKDEFFIHVNPIEKRVMYYAYDIKDFLDNRHINEEEGYMSWDQVADCIYNFFVICVKDLTDIVAPYEEAVNGKPIANSSSTTRQHSSYTYDHGNYNHTSHYNSSPHGYGTSAYKEREAFCEKLWALLKENKTSHAMDHIGATLGKMCDDKKFDELDSLLRLINFDKLSITTMLGVLDATAKADEHLKARKDFFDKVRTHLTKIKPARAKDILRNLEPGKIKNAKPDIRENKAVQ